MNLDAFETIAKSRRSIRHFKPDPIPGEVVERLVDIAHWAPSGYNLQPTHFVIVTKPEQKEKLQSACLGQRQVLEAPVVVVFTGDRRVMENHFEAILEQDKELGAMNPDYERLLRKFVPLAFSTTPLGLGWLWKAAVLPLVNLIKPVPEMPAVHKRYWLAKQVSLAAMNFMLAAHAAGLATVPMEGFAEKEVRQVLNIPKTHIVSLIIPLGYAKDVDVSKSRLPLEKVVHREGW